MILIEEFFSVSISRTILIKLIYKEKYDIIEDSMSDSNIGARKKKNIRNHIFVVNSVSLWTLWC